MLLAIGVRISKIIGCSIDEIRWRRRAETEIEGTKMNELKELTAFVVPGMSMLVLHSLVWVCYAQTCISLSLKAHNLTRQDEAVIEPQMPEL